LVAGRNIPKVDNLIQELVDKDKIDTNAFLGQGAGVVFDKVGNATKTMVGRWLSRGGRAGIPVEELKNKRGGSVELRCGDKVQAIALDVNEVDVFNMLHEWRS
jgi:hypothetical protein